MVTALPKDSRMGCACCTLFWICSVFWFVDPET